MPLCIEVDKKLTEMIIKKLRSLKLLNEDYAIHRIGDRVLIPLKESAGSEITVGEFVFRVFVCEVPERRRTRVKLPSLDVLGDVVIIRENVLGYWDPLELVEAIRQVYPRIKAIWVKELTTEEYRKPVLKLLWGEEKRDVFVKEHGLLFKVRLGEVYYNPRLSEEHHRIALLVNPGEVVVDLFSGIGGFAVHTVSQKPCLVIANDVNPAAYDLLLENIALNKKKLRGTIIPFNMDARDIPSVLREQSADRLIADLPMWSTEFTQVYSEVVKPGGVLHLYRLSRDVEVLREELMSVFQDWRLLNCRLVMEYAPRAGIFRCDLVKPKDV